jgi:serine/threonine protein kinase
MVMEFVRGETLESMVSRMGPLSAQRAAELCMQTLAALAHAHSMGVVHRDLKPANVMITENGAVKVMDFGIARVSGSEHLTNAGFMMGTPAYMAPEQVRGGDVDARADLYAMGVVFYRLTTSKLPFKGDTAFSMVQSQVNDPPTPALSFRHDLPAWVDEVVTRALEKAPEQRFQSAAEFHEAFARCLAGLPLSSMYGGDPMMTPSRAMPSGAFARSAMGHSTPFPGIPSGSQPMTTGSQPTMRSPSTHQGVIVGSGDPTMLTPSAAPAITGTVPPPTTSLAPLASAPKKSNLSLILGVAGLVVIAGSLGAWLLLQSVAPPVTPPATDAQNTSTPPAGADQNAVAIPAATLVPGPSVMPAGPAASLPPGPSPIAATSSTASAAPGVTPAPRNVARTGATPTPMPTPAATPAAAAPSVPSASSASNTATTAAATDPLATFPNVKIYVVEGKRGADRDVLLNFAAGQVMVMPKNGGEAIAVVPYKKMLKATYTVARDPKWDASLPGPPEGFDVGTFMRTTRHWLVVQGSERFAVLRLEDNNVRQILETFEARTGLKVERLK